MKLSLRDGTGDVVVLDTEWSEKMLDECDTCKRSTPTLTVRGAWTYDNVEICPECLIKALSDIHT